MESKEPLAVSERNKFSDTEESSSPRTAWRCFDKKVSSDVKCAIGSHPFWAADILIVMQACLKGFSFLVFLLGAILWANGSEAEQKCWEKDPKNGEYPGGTTVDKSVVSTVILEAVSQLIVTEWEEKLCKVYTKGNNENKQWILRQVQIASVIQYNLNVGKLLIASLHFALIPDGCFETLFYYQEDSFFFLVICKASAGIIYRFLLLYITLTDSKQLQRFCWWISI